MRLINEIAIMKLLMEEGGGSARKMKKYFEIFSHEIHTIYSFVVRPCLILFFFNKDLQ